MIILAIDTTAITASVALLDDENVISSFDVHNKLTHSEKILPMIDCMLNASGLSFGDVELVAVSVGPGSFTGVRIGVSTAKGLAYPRNLPIVGVSSLEALAESFRFLSAPKFDEIILSPSMDARRNELYNGLFKYNGSEIERLTEDRPISCEELEQELLSYNKTVFINGDGAEKLNNFLLTNASVKSEIAPQLILRQSAVSVGKVALCKYRNGIHEDVNKISPLYLRTSQAERVNNKEK